MNDLFTIARKDGSGAIIWSEDQKRFIIHEYQDKDNTLKAIAEMFQVRPESVRNLLRKENIEITNKKIRNYPRNSNYFNDIDTSEKAYWLGLFYADGTIEKNGNQIALSLKDKEHVEKFKNAINAFNNKIVEIKDNRFSKICYLYEFTIRDKGLHDGLLQHGVLPNKSYQLFGLPQLSDNNLMRHFIRGYYDGDGGLSYKICEIISQSTFTVSLTGNFQFLTELKKFLNREKLSLSQNSVSKITYQFAMSGRQQVLSFLKWLYQDADESIRLDRKYNKYLELLHYEAPHPRTRTCEVWPAIE